MSDFQIAGVRLRLEMDCTPKTDGRFHPFLTTEGEPDYIIRVCQVEALPPIPAEVIHEEKSYRVHPDGRGGYIRSFIDAPLEDHPYAVVTDDGEQIRVDYLAEGIGCVSQITNCFFYPGFEELMLRKDRLCFHAACVDTPLGGILFSGRSGIGKSTQAELWCRHRNARQINGDRPILSQDGDGWRAWGSPYAGSSGVHVNESCTVSAIIMLRQAKSCSLRRLDPGEAFRTVWSGMTMHSWNGESVERTCDLTLALIERIPVWEFACTPDAAAVDYLERELRKEGHL